MSTKIVVGRKINQYSCHIHLSFILEPTAHQADVATDWIRSEQPTHMCSWREKLCPDIAGFTWSDFKFVNLRNKGHRRNKKVGVEELREGILELVILYHVLGWSISEGSRCWRLEKITGEGPLALQGFWVLPPRFPGCWEVPTIPKIYESHSSF